MKTIFDAVNELKGEVLDVDVKNIIFRPSTGELRVWHKSNLYDLNTPTWVHLCSIEEFNALVDAMSTNFGESFTYHDYKINFKGIITDRLMPIMQTSSTYTQEMHDKDEVTPIGCEVVLNLLKGARNVTDDDLSHNGETMRVVALTQHKLPVLLNETNFFCYVCNNAHFKPLTPPVPLINGKAYQFINEGATIEQGIYYDGMLINQHGSAALILCTNIKPLTLAGE